MKKLVLLIIMMFSFVVVNADETVNVRLEWVPNVYYNYEKDGLNYWGQFAYIYAGDKVAYCLDISQNINSAVYTKSDEVQSNNLVVLAGYFGYGYDNNVSLKDYMATQALIWSYLGTNVNFTTKSNGAGETIDIFDDKVKIVYRINNHATFPSYNTDFKFMIGSSNNILQKNSINNGYNILNNTSNVIQFNNNGILFNANEVGKNNFYLETKYIKYFDNQIYIADNSQKIMIIGNINNIKRKYSYEVIGGTLNINVSYIKNINQANISDNLFEIYNENNELIGTFRPDESGNIIVNNLNIGKYKIKELSISEGYNVSPYESDFEITNDSLNQFKEIYLYPKTINITINKTFSNTIINDLNYDSDIIYKIYDFNNNYIKELLINEEGKTSTTLEYGNYKIVQTNVNKINIYHEDIIIDTSMFSNDLIFNIHDNISKAKIRVMTVDKNTNEKISGVSFKINNDKKITNDDGIYITDLLDFGIYKFGEFLKEGYSEYQSFDYTLDENSKYSVFENEAYVDLLIYLEKIKEPSSTTKPDESIDDKNSSINDNEEETIIDTNNSKEDIPNEFENTFSDNEKLEQDLADENVNINNIDNIDNIDNLNEDIIHKEVGKLPFLGECYEKKVSYNFINYFFISSWLFCI